MLALLLLLPRGNFAAMIINKFLLSSLISQMTRKKNPSLLLPCVFHSFWQYVNLKRSCSLFRLFKAYLDFLVLLYIFFFGEIYSVDDVKSDEGREN